MTYRCEQQNAVSSDGHPNVAVIMADYRQTHLASQVQQNAFNCLYMLPLTLGQCARLHIRATWLSGCNGSALGRGCVHCVDAASVFSLFPMSGPFCYAQWQVPQFTSQAHFQLYTGYAVEEHNDMTEVWARHCVALDPWTGQCWNPVCCLSYSVIFYQWKKTKAKIHNIGTKNSSRYYLNIRW